MLRFLLINSNTKFKNICEYVQSNEKWMVQKVKIPMYSYVLMNVLHKYKYRVRNNSRSIYWCSLEKLFGKFV